MLVRLWCIRPPPSRTTSCPAQLKDGTEHKVRDETDHASEYATAGQMADALVEHTFANMDIDGNGWISRAEFTKWLSGLRGYAQDADARAALTTPFAHGSEEGAAAPKTGAVDEPRTPATPLVANASTVQTAAAQVSSQLSALEATTHRAEPPEVHSPWEARGHHGATAAAAKYNRRRGVETAALVQAAPAERHYARDEAQRRAATESQPSPGAAPAKAPRNDQRARANVRVNRHGSIDIRPSSPIAQLPDVGAWLPASPVAGVHSAVHVAAARGLASHTRAQRSSPQEDEAWAAAETARAAQAAVDAWRARREGERKRSADATALANARSHRADSRSPLRASIAAWPTDER